MIRSRHHGQHTAGPPSLVGVGTLCKRERQRRMNPPPLHGAGKPSIHFFLSASEPLGLRLLDSGPTVLGSWRDLGGTGRAAGTGNGGPRGGSSYQPVLVHMLGAFRGWL